MKMCNLASGLKSYENNIWTSYESRYQLHLTESSNVDSYLFMQSGFELWKLSSDRKQPPDTILYKRLSKIAYSSIAEETLAP